MSTDSSKGSFRRSLADADRALAAVAMPPARDREIRAMLAAPRSTWTRWLVAWRRPVLGLAAVAIAATIIIVMRDRAAPSTHHVAGFDITAPTTSWHLHDDEIEIVAPQLVLDARGFGRIVAHRGARLARVEHGIRVATGHVELDVAHRGAGESPAIVRVSHGIITVLGTRFVIDQTASSGRVVLHEGKIRFESADRVVELHPGESLAWPLLASSEPPSPTVATAPPSTTPTTPPSPAVKPAPRAPSHIATPARPQLADPFSQTPAADADGVLAELASLRARGRYAEASAFVEHALTEPLPAATLERLSYELGAIEAYQLRRSDRACRHWRAHREQFPQGRYTEEIEAGIKRLECKENTP